MQVQVQQDNIVSLNLRFSYSVYENSNNGYCVFQYKNESNTKKQKKLITCTGINLPKDKKLVYECSGQWKDTAKYGMQFEIKSFIIYNTENREDIINFLSSKSFNGIGKKLAESIYDMYGNDCFRIIENYPELLTSIKGMSTVKAYDLSNSYKSNIIGHRLSKMLAPYNISSNVAINAAQELRLKNIETLTNNPYLLYKVKGISLEIVDMLAQNLGFSLEHIDRVEAYANNVLIENEISGSTCMPYEKFISIFFSKIKAWSLNQNILTEHIYTLIKRNKLHLHTCVKDGIYFKTISRTSTYNKEYYVAEKLTELLKCKQQEHQNLVSFIDNDSRKKNICYDYQQIEAVKKSICESVCVVTGGPGMGKTTIINLIAKFLKLHEPEKKIYFIAPSGKAARRITESTGFDASTIHSLLKLQPDGIKQNAEEVVILENATIIMDESSMTGLDIMYKLLKAIQPGCRFILIGDVNQLPSVDCGAVLRDIINSNTIPGVRLSHIYRQSKDSEIALNAKKITEGKHNIKEGVDFKIINSNSPSEAELKILSRYMYHTQGDIEQVKNIYCLCPIKDREVGVRRMNTLIQNMINPHVSNSRQIQIGDYTYRIGDPVMQLINDGEISNGDVGIVVDILKNKNDELSQGKLVVEYSSSTERTYTLSSQDDITLAYAFTVHKSQGCENRIILMYLSECIGKKMLSRNLLNTAITRGSELVEVFTTNDNAINIAIDNDISSLRDTCLEYELRV